jgi:hypothetical protein
MAAISPELKSAILEMPSKERDKLLLRLAAKDKLLIDQLQFKLVEEGLSIESRRQAVQDSLDAIYRQNINNTKALFAEIREASVTITWHVKVTKDKYGEVDLLLNLLFDPFDMKPHMFSDWRFSDDRFCQFLAKKAKTLCNKYDALDEEFKLDFATKLNKLVNHLHTSSAGFFARDYGIPKEIDF